MIHEIKDFNRIAAKIVKHTELILTISGRCLMCLKLKFPVLCMRSVLNIVFMFVFVHRVMCIPLTSAVHTHSHMCPDWYNLERRAVSDYYRKQLWRGRRGQISKGEERKEEMGVWMKGQIWSNCIFFFLIFKIVSLKKSCKQIGLFEQKSLFSNIYRISCHLGPFVNDVVFQRSSHEIIDYFKS